MPESYHSRKIALARRLVTLLWKDNGDPVAYAKMINLVEDELTREGTFEAADELNEQLLTLASKLKRDEEPLLRIKAIHAALGISPHDDPFATIAALKNIRDLALSKTSASSHKRPTIAELDRILNDPAPRKVYTREDGEISTRPIWYIHGQPCVELIRGVDRLQPNDFYWENGIVNSSGLDNRDIGDSVYQPNLFRTLDGTPLKPKPKS